jgi:hypothetical protein
MPIDYMLNSVFSEYHYSECHVESRYDKCCSDKSRYAGCLGAHQYSPNLGIQLVHLVNGIFREKEGPNCPAETLITLIGLRNKYIFRLTN